jgi:hypothetical protein
MESCRDDYDYQKVYDLQAKQQIEEGGKVWLSNRYKILYGLQG